MLGPRPRGIEERTPRIVDFSELGDFIDQPIKTYSTGMVMRLGFAIATQVEPDVLIIDEALSVGDGYFQQKCMVHLQRYVDNGGTLLICSHAMYYVSAFCRRALWMRDGDIEALGPVEQSYPSTKPSCRPRPIAAKRDQPSGRLPPERRRASSDVDLRSADHRSPWRPPRARDHVDQRRTERGLSPRGRPQPSGRGRGRLFPLPPKRRGTWTGRTYTGCGCRCPTCRCSRAASSSTSSCSPRTACTSTTPAFSTMPSPSSTTSTLSAW